jgi:hypothetical protein
VRRKVFAAGLLSLLVLGAAAGPADARRRCAAQDSKTLVASERVRIFAWHIVSAVEYDVYGCLYRRNRRYKLDHHSTPEPDGYASWNEVKLITVAGRYVAWAKDSGFEFGNLTSVTVVDLRTGAAKHSWDAGGGGYAQDTPDWETHHRGVWSVTDLVLKPGGAVGWIVGTFEGDWYFDEQPAVYKSDATVEGMQLDRGTGLSKESLAASGSDMYWMNDGQPRSAAFY